MAYGSVLGLLGAVLVISISGAFMPGPVFAATVVRAKDDRFAGPRVALGHALIEMPLIAIAALGIATFLKDARTQAAIGIFGGVMLLIIAYQMFRGGNAPIEEGERNKTSLIERGGPELSGLITTGTNPYFFLWWATVGSVLILAAMEYGPWVLVGLALVHWSTDVGWLFLVGYSVHKSKKFWKGPAYKMVFYGCGALMAIFGVWFLFIGSLILL